MTKLLNHKKNKIRKSMNFIHWIRLSYDITWPSTLSKFDQVFNNLNNETYDLFWIPRLATQVQVLAATE
jgi:hypothetical protein